MIADETADPSSSRPTCSVRPSTGPTPPRRWSPPREALGRAVVDEVERQLGELSTEPIAGPAWRNYGSVTVADDRETAVALMDDLAPEHLEVITADDDWYHDHLRNYGSIFLGPWSTVAYSDKGMAGTNHVLPTAGGARHSAGLSVSRFLKPLTYQRVAGGHADAGRCRRRHLRLRGHGRPPRDRDHAPGGLRRAWPSPAHCRPPARRFRISMANPR